MKPLPEILITGFPNSGTSFLCNLIVALGKSPGNKKNLKKGDSHNRWGYFENLRLREISWQTLPNGHLDISQIPPQPYSFSNEKLAKYSTAILKTAKDDNIEVYKDNALPLIFRIFPIETKYIIIKRNSRACYDSPRKVSQDGYSYPFEEFLIYYNNYHKLVQKMKTERNCLEINYEDFFADFDGSLNKISRFLNIKTNKQLFGKCRRIFRPSQNNVHKNFHPFNKLKRKLKLILQTFLLKIRQYIRLIFFNKNIIIDSPVFIIGLQGGGLTIISRILRRNPLAVSVRGNYKNWYCADEMQNELSKQLPEEFRLFHSRFFGQKGFWGGAWLYGTDKFFHHFRKTEKDATPALKKSLISAIKKIIARYAVSPNKCRFIDKSQSYGLKIKFLNAILKDYHPKFLLITRNPYIMCPKAVHKPALALLDIPHKEKLKLAAEHYKNCMETIIKDGQEINNLYIMRFEDFLENPEESIRKCCKYLELKYYNGMLPQPTDKEGGEKWYPIRKNVNQEWLDKLSQEEKEIIERKCSDLITKLGYELEKK